MGGMRIVRASAQPPTKLPLGSWLAMMSALALPTQPAVAAPLDALLTATPELTAPQAYLELGVDRLNRALDFSTSGQADTGATTGSNTSRSASGNYQGVHAAGGWKARDGLWLMGSLWQRNIRNGTDTFGYVSWQASGLIRLHEANGALPAVALRLSAWGNRASATETSTPVHVPGTILNSVKITRPSDQQLQADLVGTWPVSAYTHFSALLGAGSTRLAYGELSATTTRNGCNYQLSFNGNDIFGVLAEACKASGGVIQQFYDSSGDYGVDVAKEIAWRGHFVQAGFNADWRSGPWTLLGGYLFHSVRRQAVDAILAGRGDPVFQRNHVVTLESAYQFQPRLGVFLRAQISSNLFLNDLPVTYNTSTSGSFGNRFSLFTLGLRAGF